MATVVFASLAAATSVRATTASPLTASPATASPATASPATTIPAATVPGPPNPIPRRPLTEGVYEGVLSWPLGRYRFVAGETNLQSRWSLRDGTVRLTVTGTTVSGEWSFTMESSGSGSSSGGRSGEASGVIAAAGTFAGDANAPCMTGSAQLVGEMIIQDPSGLAVIPLDETLPIDCTLFTWWISSASCSAASGEWTLPLADVITGTGASFPTNGTFTLWRVAGATTSDTERAEIAAQLDQMEQIIGTDPVDGAALSAVLRRIAAFDGNSARNVACGERSSENLRLAGDQVHRLIITRFLTGEPIDLRTLRWLAYAALNTGQIGSAAPQRARADGLERQFHDRLLALLDAAQAARDADQIARIEVFARQYGWEQLEAVAADAYRRIRGD
jgi:hypothetical protein